MSKKKTAKKTKPVREKTSPPGEDWIQLKIELLLEIRGLQKELAEYYRRDADLAGLIKG